MTQIKCSVPVCHLPFPFPINMFCHTVPCHVFVLFFQLAGAQYDVTSQTVVQHAILSKQDQCKPLQEVLLSPDNPRSPESLEWLFCRVGDVPLRIAPLPLCVLPGCPCSKDERFSFSYLCKMTVFDYSPKNIYQGLPRDRQGLGASHTNVNTTQLGAHT